MYTTNYIRIDGKRVLVKEALEIMTDEWLQKEKEKYSWVTVKNLRDIIKEYQIFVEYLEERNKLDKKDFDEKLVIAEKFNKEWRKYNPEEFDWHTTRILSEIQAQKVSDDAWRIHGDMNQ